MRTSRWRWEKLILCASIPVVLDIHRQNLENHVDEPEQTNRHGFLNGCPPKGGSMTKSPRFAGIGGHHSNQPQTVEWLTPPEIIAALGPFDLDPSVPEIQPYPTAMRTFTRRDNGLLQRWNGRVWLNPPYTNSEIGRWLARMAEHNCGTALIFARTETEAFFSHVWAHAHALLFMRGRINFHLPDGSRASGNAGAPTVLCAYGATDAEILAGCEIAGKFVPLIFPRSVLVTALCDVTWREALSEFLNQHGEPIALSDLYQAFVDHPKAKQNPHWREKLRQTLQQGVGKRIARGQWVAA